jgi:hydrogenase nickel incorporation protein HypA/HybF
MHELSVCQALISQVENIVKQHKSTAVDEIIIQIGPLSGIEPELLNNAYSIACRGTVADKAVLRIETMPITIFCQHCNKQAAVEINKLICPACGDYRTQLISGDEMILKTVGLITREKEQNYV